MAQTLSTISASRKKIVIELVNEESDSKSNSSDSVFKTRIFKKAKAKKMQKVEKNSKVKKKKKLMAQARKSLEEKMILYPCQYKKPDIESS
eukprot:4787752-Ditylum_brightwellii.AAC.1